MYSYSLIHITKLFITYLNVITHNYITKCGFDHMYNPHQPLSRQNIQF